MIFVFLISWNSYCIWVWSNSHLLKLHLSSSSFRPMLLPLFSHIFHSLFLTISAADLLAFLAPDLPFYSSEIPMDFPFSFIMKRRKNLSDFSTSRKPHEWKKNKEMLSWDRGETRITCNTCICMGELKGKIYLRNHSRKKEMKKKERLNNTPLMDVRIDWLFKSCSRRRENSKAKVIRASRASFFFLFFLFFVCGQ